ncbi:hypothetical protein C8R43DRAFT_1234584 [Mycena crocata]|nr:hypothetical protein C8R43DRAFT_1234584 [Mycena crocata]
MATSATEAQILDLKRSILSLRRDEELAQRRLDSYAYPVLTLPNEITSEIFLQFLPAYPSCPHTNGFPSPTVLAHICRIWRETALATPSLWRAISLIFEDYDSDERNNRRLLSSLARSRSLPLSIYMHVAHFDQPPNKCINTISLHRARWEYLDLDAIGPEPETVSSLFCDPMPSLRQMTLAFDENFEVPITLADAPLLRSVSQSLSRLLKQATSLLHCELSFCWEDDGDDDDLPQFDIHLPCLQSLLVMHESEDVPALICIFIVSALHTLQVPDPFLGNNPVLALKSFIQKSGCSLKELRITPARGENRGELYRKVFASIPKVSCEADA